MTDRALGRVARRLALITLLGASGAGAHAASVRLPPVREARLSNGARVLLGEKHDVPLIAFAAYLHGGSVTDPPGKEGLADFTAEMLRKGAGKRSALEIAAATDGSGARLVTGASHELAWITGEFLARDEGLLIELLRDVLTRPTFPDSEVTKLKRQSIDALRSAKDDPNNLLDSYGRAFFMPRHPYGRPVEGDEVTLERITREDVLEAYRSQFGGDRLVLALVGDFDAKRLEGKIRRALGSWRSAAATLPAVPTPDRPSGRRVVLVDKPDATQTYFWIGNRGVSRLDPDRDAVDVANTAFGGRFTSMLNTALRIRTGLTYGARSRLFRPTQPGTFAIRSYTQTDSTRRAIDIALETLRAFRSTGLDTTTLASVKQYLAGLYPTDFETGDQIAGALGDLAFYGLPETDVTGYIDRIGSLPKERVDATVRRVYPAPEDLTFVLIGNAARLRTTARRYGSVVEARFDQPLTEAIRVTAARGR